MNVKVFNCDKSSIIYKMHEMINGGLFQEGDVTFFCHFRSNEWPLDLHDTHQTAAPLGSVSVYLPFTLLFTTHASRLLKNNNKSIH